MRCSRSLRQPARRQESRQHFKQNRLQLIFAALKWRIGLWTNRRTQDKNDSFAAEIADCARIRRLNEQKRAISSIDVYLMTYSAMILCRIVGLCCVSRVWSHVYSAKLQRFERRKISPKSKEEVRSIKRPGRYPLWLRGGT